MNKFKTFLDIVKVDEDERMVYGWASTEDLDSDGEIIKASALEKALPGYMQYPTLREMHQAKVAGTTIEATIKKDDNKKGLYIGAKILAEDAWNLVKGGGYKAFSIGGNVLKKTGNVIHELDLIEISLVDVPANKAAVIEVWKKHKLNKDAETAYTMSNLMINIKETIYYYDYLGKDTKKLKKILELVKQILVQEASEEETDTKSQMANTLKALKAMSFEKGSLAEALRKGVILGMNKSQDKVEDQDDPKKGETEEEVENEETEATEEDSEEKSESEETTTDDESEEDSEVSTEATETDSGDVETEDEKETSEAEPDLQKIQEANAKLEKLSPKKEKNVTPATSKAVKSLVESVSKMVDVMTSLTKRVESLEQTPAAPKSKSSVVFKNKEENKTEKKDSEVLATKKARLAELGKIFDQLGPNEFAKQGHSKEAMQLQDEIAKLQAE